MIEAENIIKIFKLGMTKVHALKKVSVKIEDGEMVAIVGPSGSGKSTLMSILGCLDVPTRGTYRIDGKPVDQLKENQLAAIRSKKIGFVFQKFNLLPRTSALENVMLPLLYKRNGKMTDEQQKGKALEVLDAVGLADRVDHKPQELSGGQMQRVAVARALVNDPVLILADEPTGNLDTRSGEEIMALLRDLHAQGRTIVMVTHADEIAAYAQRIIRFRDGRIETDKQNGDFAPQTVVKEEQHVTG